MPAQTKINVFIAEEQELLLRQLMEQINAEPDLCVTGTATDGVALVNYFKNGNKGVDIALVDIGMPKKDGLIATAEIKEICPQLKAIIITGLNGRDYPSEAVGKHADGFVAKYHGIKTIIEAIRQVHSGNGFVYLPDPTDPAQPAEAPRPIPRLTPVERKVLCTIAKGAINKEAADKLGISEKMIEKYRGSATRKLGADNPVVLGILVEKYGLCREKT